MKTDVFGARASLDTGFGRAQIYRLDAHAIQPGAYLTLTDPEGECLPFVVKALSSA